MKHTLDYVFRPSSPDEQTERVEVRLSAKAYGRAEKWVERAGGALPEFLDRNEARRLARAVREGLEQKGGHVPFVGRQAEAKAIHPIFPSQNTSAAQDLTPQDRADLKALVVLLDGVGSRNGVRVLRTLPRL